MAAASVVLAGVTLSGDTTVAHPREPKASGVGRLAPLPNAKGIDGRVPNVRSLTVVAFTGVDCPVAKKLGPTLARLEDEYRSQGVEFIFVNPTEAETVEQMRADVARLNYDGVYVRDASQQWVAALGAKTTTEVFLIDANRTILYRGAIDDQYGISSALPEPRNRYLADALDAAIAGKPIPVAATWAPGCVLEAPVPAKPVAATYHNRISRIIQQSCLPCHSEGGVAPFRLDRYGDVKSRAPMIQYAIQQGIMPPWGAKPEPEGLSKWRNDRTVPQADKDALAEWIAAGMPEGNAKDAPAPLPKPESEWVIGKPDAVYQIPRAIEVPAQGVMDYINLEVPTDLTEDKWVEAMEVRPTARSVVHHVLIFVLPPGERRGDDIGAEINGFFAAWVPGTSAIQYPQGFAKPIPKGSRLWFQIHYTPNGEATRDQVSLGLRFARGEVRHEVRTMGIVNPVLRIPPGAKDHRVTGLVTAPSEVRLLSLIPHMHLRGKAAKYEAVTASGERETLLEVPRYDFNWQIAYEYRDPKVLPQGSRIEYTAWYDNSDANPNNPDPNATVRWGQQTTDEMHLGYVEYYIPSAKPGEPAPGLRRNFPMPDRAERNNAVMMAFDRIDANKDGFVDAAEAGDLWRVIQRADTNGDGKISRQEAQALRLGG